LGDLVLGPTPHQPMRRFSFPVDEGVLVSEFRVYVQSDPPRIIRADVAEKEEAQNKYEDIIAFVHSLLLSSQRSNQ
jgi:hypothetical protein